MWQRCGVVAAISIALAAGPAQAEEECKDCWSPACPELSSYVPQCKAKHRKAPTTPPPPRTTTTPPPPDTGPAPRKISIEAATALSTAKAFIAAGKLSDALPFANQAVTLAPGWADAVMVRALIHLQSAGPASELAALSTPDLQIDYAAMVVELKAALEDYKAALPLETEPKKRDGLVEAVGDLTARVMAAQKDAATVPALRQAQEDAIRQQQAAQAAQVAEQQRQQRLHEEQARQQQEQQLRQQQEAQRQQEEEARRQQLAAQHEREAQEKAQAAAAEAAANAISVRGGFELAGDFFPISSAQASGSTSISVFAGGRFLLGAQLPHGFSLVGFLQGGYAAAGKAPGSGADGIVLGLGPEVDYDTSDQFGLFLRLNLDAKAVSFSSFGGSLADVALYGAAGMRVFHVIDLHVLAGADLSGGFGLGFGVGLGYF